MSFTFQQILKFCMCDGQLVREALAKSWCYSEFLGYRLSVELSVEQVPGSSQMQL